MREILFRGKDKDGNWVEGDLIHGVRDKKGNLYILPIVSNLVYIPNCHPLDGVEVIPETVCQFTGLTDKNGVKIFEGDIVNHSRRTSNGFESTLNEVYYDNELLEFGIKQSYEPFHCQFNFEFEKFGNIHDNPELLNK